MAFPSESPGKGWVSHSPRKTEPSCGGRAATRAKKAEIDVSNDLADC